jgi:inosine-uridine nucleoside N-ribohydrolase
MTKHKIWLDCDPGHDDMLAIIMAVNSGQCQLLGISTSAGNSFIENTTQNTLNIL